MCLFAIHSPSPSAWFVGNSVSLLSTWADDVGQEGIIPNNRGYPCFGLAAIFVGMLYNVQIIQKCSTWNVMHVSIAVLELPAKLRAGSLIKWIEWRILQE